MINQPFEWELYGLSVTDFMPRKDFISACVGHWAVCWWLEQNPDHDYRRDQTGRDKYFDVLYKAVQDSKFTRTVEDQIATLVWAVNWPDYRTQDRDDWLWKDITKGDVELHTKLFCDLLRFEAEGRAA